MINKELKKQIVVRFQVIGSIIIDSIFLLLWLIVTVFVSDVTSSIIIGDKLNGIDKIIFRTFQWLFTGSTFIAVMRFLIIDVWTIIMKARHEIFEISQKKSIKSLK